MNHEFAKLQRPKLAVHQGDLSKDCKRKNTQRSNQNRGERCLCGNRPVDYRTDRPANQWYLQRANDHNKQQSIAFRRGQSDGTLVRLELASGTAMNLLHLGAVPGTFLHWGTDDKIIYSGGPKGLYRISATGGTPEFPPHSRSLRRTGTPPSPVPDPIPISAGTWPGSRPLSPGRT